MVIEFVLNTLLAVVQAVLDAVLPATNVSLSAATGVVHWYAYFNGFLPLSEGLELIGVAVGVLVVIGALRVVMTVWSLVPGKAT